MYAFLNGVVDDPGPPTVVAVGGVGYEVWVPERQRLALGPAGSTVRLHTHLYVREDAFTLYGFPSTGERELFRALLGVSGVGPKVALALLGGDDSGEVLRSIESGDVARLTRVKGVGRKTAERLIVDLRDRASAWGVTSASATPAGKTDDEAALALMAMGVAEEKAKAAIAALDARARAGGSVEELVRLALRHGVG